MGNLFEAQGQDRVKEAWEVAVDLIDDWGLPFYGRAETITGGVWWYEKDGKRYALRPAHVAARAS